MRLEARGTRHKTREDFTGCCVWRSIEELWRAIWLCVRYYIVVRWGGLGADVEGEWECGVEMEIMTKVEGDTEVRKGC
jgi:hypothetical protein